MTFKQLLTFELVLFKAIVVFKKYIQLKYPAKQQIVFDIIPIYQMVNKQDRK